MALEPDGRWFGWSFRVGPGLGAVKRGKLVSKKQLCLDQLGAVSCTMEVNDAADFSPAEVIEHVKKLVNASAEVGHRAAGTH